MRRTGSVLALLIGLISCGSLDAVDYVHDLRMLAMQADPPQQAINPNALVTSAQQGQSSTTAVTVTALVADPAGAGRDINYTFATCAALDTNSQRCLTSATGYQVVHSGVANANDGYVEISTQFTPSDTLLLEALAADTYHGFDGLQFPVQLSVDAGDEHVTGVKLVVYMPPYPGVEFTPATIPSLVGVTVEGTPWTSSGYTFSSKVQPADGWVINPVFDPNAQAAYQLPAFDGTVLDFTESWLFDYFTTFASGFSPTTSGGFQIATNVPNPANTLWNPSETTAIQTGLFYLVIRNGRGGESWVILPATWTP